jgi:ABC-type multidrug transport system permease subunit
MNKYLSKSFDQIEVWIGIVLSVLIIVFSFMFGTAKGIEFEPFVSFLVVLFCLAYAFGLIVGLRGYYYLIVDVRFFLVKILFFLILFPLAAYTGWDLAIVKSYRQFTS